MKENTNWPIFRPNLSHEPTLILKEFEDKAFNLLGPVLEEGVAWNGVCVYHEKTSVWKANPSRMSINEMPKLKEFIEQYFDLNKIRMINIYNLEPGTKLHPHRDMEGNLILGMIRVHYCLKTNKECRLLGEYLEPGKFLSFSTSELHNAENNGLSNRIHLVVDLKRSKKNKVFFPKITLVILFRLLDRTTRIFFLLLRDIIKRPKSILSRIKSIVGN